MEPCEFAERCLFFRAHRYEQRTVRRKILDLYCLGEFRESCARRAHQLAHGEMPEGDVLPTETTEQGGDGRIALPRGRG